MENQVSIFDSNEMESTKYTYREMPEFATRVILSFEKEVLGIYLSGHPLEKYKNKINKLTNINSLNIMEIDNELEEDKENSYKDGQTIRIIGIVSKVKKKTTKKNTLMAFVTLDDLYGSIETIVFESIWERYSQYFVEEKILLIEGRLSIREDEPTKIVVANAKEILNEDEKEGYINIDITNFSEEQKEKLRQLIRHYSKMNNANTRIDVTINGEVRSCGKILLNEENRDKFNIM